ncbi:hypothetical protein DPMN_142650 [Dreissena polymorpha]|uniref:Uncharacterized protein n=1 Tax=Dreissena polymorpha TaxID=45954 RepID=A0A9D4GHM7_DREPO|nr:hypothetical protein DPMN_142650 [Dreissena polymorpha]
MYSIWYVVVVHLSGAGVEEFVGGSRPSVSRARRYLVPVHRAQGTPPPHKRTHAGRARTRQHKHTVRPEPPTACASRDKRTLNHPLAARDNKSVKGQPRSLTEPHPESLSSFPTRLPNIQIMHQAGMY